MGEGGERRRTGQHGEVCTHSGQGQVRDRALVSAVPLISAMKLAARQPRRVVASGSHTQFISTQGIALYFPIWSNQESCQIHPVGC